MFITEPGTAVDPRNALRAISAVAKALGISGVGLHRLRHATRMLAAGVPLHTVLELLGHSCVVVTGGVYGHPPRRVCPPPSNGSQQQWAGENVCRCYTVATPLLHGSKEAASDFGVLRHECGSPHRSERGFLVVRQGFWAGAGGPVSCTRLATGFRGSEKMRPMRIKRPCG